MKKIFAILATITLLMSCSHSENAETPETKPQTNPEEVVNFYFTAPYLTLKAGESATLHIRYKGNDYDLATNVAEMLFTSSDKSVASVDDKGKVTAVAPGKATISVNSSNNETEKIAVVVRDNGFIAYSNPTGEKLPVMGWFSLRPPYMTTEKYKEMADAGFNISFSHVWTRAENLAALKAAEGTGVKLLMMDLDNNRNNLADIATTYKGYSSFAGYWLYDEPSVKLFSDIATWNSEIRKIDTSNLTYVNLFPDYASATAMGAANYEEYFTKAIDQLGVNFISFDYYPIVNGALRTSFYPCLETVKRLSDSRGLPFWAFAMSVLHRSYSTPTEANLKFEIYSALAYGAQGIQYFTYVTPVADGTDTFGIAPIDENGNKTAVYDYAKTVNTELSALSKYFLGSFSVSRMFTGTIAYSMKDEKYDAAKLPGNVTSVSSDGDGLLISHLCNGEREYMMLVNRSFTKSQNVKIAFDGTLKRINPDGTVTDAETDVIIKPGDMLLYLTR